MGFYLSTAAHQHLADTTIQYSIDSGIIDIIFSIFNYILEIESVARMYSFTPDFNIVCHRARHSTKIQSDGAKRAAVVRSQYLAKSSLSPSLRV